MAVAEPVFAQEISYDRYGPVWRGGPLKESPSPSAETLRSFGKHFLVYPFEFLRWPIDKTLVFVEDYRLYDKGEWIYEQMKNRGVTPHIRSLAGADSFGGGLNLEVIQLSGLKQSLPNLTVKGSNLWTLDHITDHHLKILQEDIGGMGFLAGGDVRYENRGEEHFYGIGPNTSRGDGTSYRMERTTLDVLGGRKFLTTWNVKGKFAFENVNITNGEDGGRGIIDEIFVRTGRQRIPALGGDEILSWGFDLEHDNRDSRDLPLEGGYQRAHFSYSKGLESSSGYFKYRLEAAHFFKLFSERRALGLRWLAEHNDEVGGRDVPFFGMARLGGYGTYPRLGDTHRGFTRDRFYDESLLLFNLEYRWTVWEYRDWKMDSVFFWDEGQVFEEWSHLQIEDFSPSYGLGFRISMEGEIVLTLEIARSSEGTQFYVKTRTPF